MKNQFKYIKYLFGIVFILQVIAILVQSYELRFVTKLMICPVLILIVFAEKGRLSKENKWLVYGLCWCFLGDLFLLFQQEMFFLLGLGSFFIGHIFYCIQFSINAKWLENKKLLSFSLMLIVVYSSSIFNLLKNDVAALRIPVLAYICIISLMFLFALARYRSVSKKGFLWVVIGALFFIISDSILAINQFTQPINNGNLWVMLTYMIAQFCITTGIIAKEEKTSIAYTSEKNR